MQIFFGQPCPCYDWVKELDGSQCKHCRGNIGLYPDSVDCSYSKVPTVEPKYAVGQKAWRVEGMMYTFGSIIRLVEWDGFEWQYTFKRERTRFSEKRVYDKKQDADLCLLRLKAEDLFKDVKNYSERYNVSLEGVQKSLLPAPEKED